MWLNRSIKQQINEVASSRPALLLTGARQTGKSSLLQRLFPDYEYVSLDLPLIAKQAQANGYQFLTSKSAPIIIDEIQYAPTLFRDLKRLIDEDRSTMGRYILTGSQKFALMQGVSESLAGRMSILELNTLSIQELFAHFKSRETVSRESMKPALTTPTLLEWIVNGGYPEIYAHQLAPTRFFSDYMATYIERDVRQLLNIKQAHDFDRFMRLLALRAGQTISMSAIANEVGVVTNTIKSWISVLEASNIIYLLKPYYENLGKRVTKSPKLYFLDTGLLCYLVNITEPDHLLNIPLLGAIYENAVLMEWLKQQSNSGGSREIYFYRNQAGLEVDFVIPKMGKLNLLECKWAYSSGVPPKNLNNMLKLVGEERVMSYGVVTQTEGRVELGNGFFVTDLLSF